MEKVRGEEANAEEVEEPGGDSVEGLDHLSSVLQVSVLPHPLDRQSHPSLPSSSIEDFATVPGLHPLEESVRSEPFAPLAFGEHGFRRLWG